MSEHPSSDLGLQPSASGRWNLHPALVDFVAGGVSGVAGIVAGQPLDVARVHQQTNSLAPSSTRAALAALLRRGGTQSLLKGIVYPVGSIAVQSAVVFQAYGAGCRVLTGSAEAVPSLPQSFLAGSAAGGLQAAIIAPSDLLKIRMQLQLAAPGAAGYLSARQMLQSVLASEGLRGLYRGYSLTLARDIPSHGLYFAAFHALSQWAEARPKLVPPAAVPFLAGGTAGVAAWLSVYPLDVLKARVQATSAAQTQHAGWWACAREVVRQQGTAGLFRGLSPTLVRAFVINAVLFTVYEPVEAYLKAL